MRILDRRGVRVSFFVPGHVAERYPGASWNKTIRRPLEVRELWEGEISGIREMGGLAMLTMHPQIIGRPGRFDLLDGLLDWVQRQNDIWMGTGREAAALVT